MRATDLTDLLAVVEEVREETHPDLPAELVRDIVVLEDQHGDDESTVLQALRSRLKDFTDSDAAEGGT